MSTPHDGTDHTGSGSRPPHDQPSSTIPAGEYIIGGPGCHLCFPRQNERAQLTEEQRADLEHVFQAVDQKRRRTWRSMGLDPGPPRVSTLYPPKETVIGYDHGRVITNHPRPPFRRDSPAW